MSSYKHLFGPVPSRRLGRSLGVDLTPCKTCSFDCVFCQLGRTRQTTLERDEYIAVSDVIDELGLWLKADGDADHITLSGSGEPTLNSGFGEVIEYVRRSTDIPAVLLTNSSTMHLAEVRDAASHANIVKASLSAWDQGSLEHLNRPCDGVAFDEMVNGLRAFRDSYEGALWLEVFVVWGMNSVADDVAKIAEIAKSIRPDRIQLNTAVRPPAEEYVHPLPRLAMERLCGRFDPPAEMIPQFHSEHSTAVSVNEESILAMLRRRPSTSEQMESAFGMHKNEMSKYLGHLMQKGSIRADHRNSSIFYSLERSVERRAVG